MDTIVAQIPLILSLVVIECLLSIDNSLVLAGLVMPLKTARERSLALKLGMLGAFVMRGASLAFVSFVVHNPWLQLLGGTYLLYLMVKHLGTEDEPETREPKVGFWATVVAVELADMAFSLDNIAAAAAFSDKLWVVLTGVFIGIVAMRFVATQLVKLLERFPVLAKVAYLLVGWVGIQLWLSRLAGVEFTEVQKMVSVLAIVAAGFVYELVPGVSTIVDPPARIFGKLCAAINSLIQLPLGLVSGER